MELCGKEITMDKQVPEHLLIEAYNAILDAYNFDGCCNYCGGVIQHSDGCILVKAREYNSDLMKAHIEEIENTAAYMEDMDRFYKDHYYDGV